MEQLGLAPAVMRKRVEEVLDLLGLAALRDRPLSGLSGGEQQRVAIGAVITAQPRVLVLDEPTSALDPAAAEDVLAALTRLVHDLGMTVVLAEHRLERVVQYADRVVAVAADGSVTDGRPQDVLATAAVVPPIVDLGLLAGWDPLPLSVRDARRRAPALRARLAPGIARDVGGPTPPMPEVLTARDVHVQHGRLGSRRRADSGDRTRRDGGACGARGGPDPSGRRRRRPDGPQRLGQDVVAMGAAGVSAPQPGFRPSGARMHAAPRGTTSCPSRCGPSGRRRRRPAGSGPPRAPHAPPSRRVRSPLSGRRRAVAASRADRAARARPGPSAPRAWEGSARRRRERYRVRGARAGRGPGVGRLERTVAADPSRPAARDPRSVARRRRWRAHPADVRRSPTD